MHGHDSADKLNKAQFAVLQKDRFIHTVKWAYERSRFYREIFEVHQIIPKEINDLSDIGALPFTERNDLLRHSPYDFLTLPLSGIVRVNMCADAAGIVKMYTSRDVACNIALNINALQAAGLNRASVAVLLTDNMHNSLVDVQCALESIGAAVVPLNIENESFLQLFDTLGADTIVGTAKKIIKLIIQLQAMGRDILELQVQRIVCINEALHNPLKAYLRQRANTKVYNVFASNEIGFSGIMFQCEEYQNQHFREDLFYPEVVAFGSDEVITDSSRMGELVITTLAAEAMPMIRYRTGQAVMLAKDACGCGNGYRCFYIPHAD